MQEIQTTARGGVWESAEVKSWIRNCVFPEPGGPEISTVWPREIPPFRCAFNASEPVLRREYEDCERACERGMAFRRCGLLLLGGVAVGVDIFRGWEWAGRGYRS